jgi:hypothetical protein
MVQNNAMRLDHISYATTHDQLADTVQRLGALLGSTFVDGGIHPRFGTRNFTAALVDGRYVEVVCPLNHPATEQTPWGIAVARKANEGGGWLTWVFSTEDISPIENKFGRKSVDGHRTLPNGTDLKWKQIGVKEISDSPELPFFIQWLTPDHPSNNGAAVAKISKIVIADRNKLSDSWFKSEILESLEGIEVDWRNTKEADEEEGLISVVFETQQGLQILD